MLKMELDNLKFRFFRFDESKVATDVKKKLNDLFEKPDKTWDDAYQIENQIAMLLTGDCLRREIKVRLREALKRNATDAAVLQTDYDGLLKSNKKEGRMSSDDFLRYFLLEVLENVHWASKLKHLARKYRREATGNTLLLAALALFFGPVAAHPAAVLVAEQLVPGADFRSIGSLFSRLITLQRPRSELKLEELHNAQKFPYIFLRACIGACGALISLLLLSVRIGEDRCVP